MVRLDDANLFIGVAHLIQHVVLYLSSVSRQVIVQQTILFRLVKLRVGELLIQLLQQLIIGFFLIQPKRVKCSHVCEMLPVLIQNDIFSIVINILVD